MNIDLRLDEVLQTNFIILESQSTTKEEVIEELTNLLILDHRIDDKDLFIQDVYERENLASTGFENGIAIPHGKSSAVKITSIAIARLKSQIDWDSIDEEPVDLVFLFAVAKEDESDNHVKLLATISQVLCEDEKVSELKRSTNPETFKKILLN